MFNDLFEWKKVILSLTQLSDELKQLSDKLQKSTEELKQNNKRSEINEKAKTEIYSIGDKVVTTTNITVKKFDKISELVLADTVGEIVYFCSDGALGVHWENSWIKLNIGPLMHETLQNKPGGHIIEVMPKWIKKVNKEM